MRLVLANIFSDMFVLIPWDSGTLLPRNNCALFPGYILAVDCRHASTVFLRNILADSPLYIPTFLPKHILADFLWDITASILWNIFTNFMRNLTLNNLRNISA